jgi:hypothetical protein
MMITFREFMKIREENGLFSQGQETGNTKKNKRDPNLVRGGASGFTGSGIQAGAAGPTAAGPTAAGPIRMKK